jgi:site-specific DNA recombinase
MKAVVYVRVSTKEQTHNLSLPTQRKACEDYCLRQGWDVARVFMEQGESAKTADRTQLQAMLAYCRANRKFVQFVVVYNLSPFSRDTGAHRALRGLFAGLGIALRSATEAIDDSPAGRLMESMNASIAQFDNDVKADRTRAGMRAALEAGRWTFQAPIGYRN